MLKTAPIYGLTLWPEWAWAKTHLDKDIENRSWFPEDRYLGQWFAIHAGKSIGGRPSRIAAQDGIDIMIETAAYAGHHVTCTNTKCPVGAPVPMLVHKDDGDVPSQIVCSAVVLLARLVDVIDMSHPHSKMAPHANYRWFVGTYGWVFADKRPLSHPVQMPGAQKIWLLPAERRREILDQL